MKVAVSASGGSLEAPVNPRFGRCPYYLIIETETMEFEAVPNASMGAPSGAGIGAAQIVAGKGVEAVLTGRVGPNAMAAFSRAGIKIVTGVQGSVRQALEAFKSGKLEAAPAVGYRGGGLFGGRGGRGMGGRRGAYPYPYPPPTRVRPTDPAPREQEREALRRQLEELEGRLKEVKQRLEELEG